MLTEGHSIQALGPEPFPSYPAAILLPQYPRHRLPLWLGKYNLALAGTHVQALCIHGRGCDHGRATALASTTDGRLARQCIFIQMGCGGVE